LTLARPPLFIIAKIVPRRTLEPPGEKNVLNRQDAKNAKKEKRERQKIGGQRSMMEYRFPEMLPLFKAWLLGG
jgi:hypothetical protein